MRALSLFLFACFLLFRVPATAEPPEFAEVPDVRQRNLALLENLDVNLPEKRVKWRHIVVHHTASEWSSLARIDAYHRKKFDDPDGIEYHFLIGNGKKAPEGLIELGRWKLQKRAIHLFKPEGAPDAIAISLVGNLHERKIRDAQYDALVDLVTRLALDHKIPVENITTHTKVDGRLTVCPGKHFPYDRFIKDVASRLRPGPEPTQTSPDR